jgi:murein DD-endopeptidase MepM/ murein hydrolase activator NlpD
VYRDPVPRFPRQLWFAVAMAVALVALVAAIRTGALPEASADGPRILPDGTRLERVELPRISVAGIVAAVRTRVAPTPTPGPTSAVSPTPSPSPTLPLPTLRPTATLAWTPTPPLRADHYWLHRPIGPEGTDEISYYYPYASRADGSYPIHTGVEFVNPLGTEVLAAGDGTIVVAGTDDVQVYGARTKFYGQLIILELDQRLYDRPIYVLYGHLSEIGVHEGQRVQRGEVIGRVGATGIAEGPHLHLEVRYGQNDYRATVNPLLWLPPFDGYGTLAGRVTLPDGSPVVEARLLLFRSGSTIPVRDMVTYPDRLVNSDPAWGETFCTGELEAGAYFLQITRGMRTYVQEFTIHAGQTTWVELQLES